MSKLTKIDIVGAGPAGLYTAILVRRHLPHVRVRVVEQNSKGATFGFGVVFSDQALDFLKTDDADIHDLILPEMERWRNMTLNLPGRQITLDGVGFTAIGRLRLLEILEEYAQGLGVEVEHERALTSLAELDGDLIVGADGLNSLVRRSDESGFGFSVEYFKNHFAWFGTRTRFETLTQTFITADRGPLNAHHYRYAPEMSTFIVDCEHPTWEAFGFGTMSEEQSAELCAELFKDVLLGAPLITNGSTWRVFPRLSCDKWFSGNRVLLGDAAHTAHFSIGSGTRLAMEDAIVLVRALTDNDGIETALTAYDAERRPIAQKLLRAANASGDWYDSFSEKMKLAPVDFAFDYLMRSGRMDLERARAFAPNFIATYETEKAAQT